MARAAARRLHGAPASLGEDEAARLAEMLRALGHPLRLRLMARLCEQATCVTDLAAALGAPQAIVSQHLRILRLSGLVDAAREHGFAVYQVTQPRLRELVLRLEGCAPP
jgi:ArsR family transcriptional regulator